MTASAFSLTTSAADAPSEICDATAAVSEAGPRAERAEEMEPAQAA